MKHTKGEWIAKEGQIYPQETGKTLALIPYFDTEDEEQKANAKLIAASPELLEAAKLALEAIKIYADDGYIMKGTIAESKLIEAIRKATT